VSNGKNLQPRDNRVESLARDIFATLLGSHYWSSTTTNHKAAESIEAAAAFYREWESKHPPIERRT
jgi:hypothetical protein